VSDHTDSPSIVDRLGELIAAGTALAHMLGAGPVDAVDRARALEDWQRAVMRIAVTNVDHRREHHGTRSNTGPTPTSRTVPMRPLIETVGPPARERRDPGTERKDRSMQDHTTRGWDRQGRAATWILAAPTLARLVERYIDFEEHEIDFVAMLDYPWSHGERAMILAANDLYNGDRSVSLDELVSTLDDGNLRIVLDAINIRRGWPIDG
jgi:hypothetical protein